jgi:hypothetical protein
MICQLGYGDFVREIKPRCMSTADLIKACKTALFTNMGNIFVCLLPLFVEHWVSVDRSLRISIVGFPIIAMVVYLPLAVMATIDHYYITCLLLPRTPNSLLREVSSWNYQHMSIAKQTNN